MRTILILILILTISLFGQENLETEKLEILKKYKRMEESHKILLLKFLSEKRYSDQQIQLEKLEEKNRKLEERVNGLERGFKYLRAVTYPNGNSVKEYLHLKTGMEFVEIPAGSFKMGIGKSAHKEQIVESFLIAKTEVTQAVWQKVMGTMPWHGQKHVVEGDDYPATYVSWKDAVDFCAKTGLSLPTEIQWEYAYRAGTETKYYWGNEIDGEYAWYDKNCNRIHSVRQKKENGFGLYDMSGNVWEWTSSNKKDSNNLKITCGGSYGSDLNHCLATGRDYNSPKATIHTIGFRPIWP